MVDLFMKHKHKCSINAIIDNAEKTQEVVTKKYDEYLNKNKKVWKEPVLTRFTDPEPLNTPLEIDFKEVMNSYLEMKKMDDEHIRIVNLELVPKEVQNYISKFKLEDEPKHHPYVDEFNSLLVKKLTST